MTATKMKRWAFQQFEPQCCRGAYHDALMNDEEYDAEIKYDGDRRIAQFCGPAVRFTGRTKSVKDGRYVERTENVPHLSGKPAPRHWPIAVEGMVHVPPPAFLEGTVLDGEMIVAPGSVPPTERGGRSKLVTSIMGSAPAVAITKQIERGWLQYVAFDCLFYRGFDLRALALPQRRAALARAVTAWNSPFVAVARTCPDRRAKRAWLDELWEQGEEGIVVKRLSAPYGKAHQSAWVKLKNVIELDVFIIGYEEANATSKKSDGTVSVTRLAERGWIGSVRFAQYRDGKVWECGAARGFDDATCKLLSENRKKFLGRVITVKGNAREPSGALRHPQWVGFRDDKRKAECVYRADES